MPSTMQVPSPPTWMWVAASSDPWLRRRQKPGPGSSCRSRSLDPNQRIGNRELKSCNIDALACEPVRPGIDPSHRGENPRTPRPWAASRLRRPPATGAQAAAASSARTGTRQSTELAGCSTSRYAGRASCANDASGMSPMTAEAPLKATRRVLSLAALARWRGNSFSGVAPRRCARPSVRRGRRGYQHRVLRPHALVRLFPGRCLLLGKPRCFSRYPRSPRRKEGGRGRACRQRLDAAPNPDSIRALPRSIPAAPPRQARTLDRTPCRGSPARDRGNAPGT